MLLFFNDIIFAIFNKLAGGGDFLIGCLRYFAVIDRFRNNDLPTVCNIKYGTLISRPAEVTVYDFNRTAVCKHDCRGIAGGAILSTLNSDFRARLRNDKFTAAA